MSLNEHQARGVLVTFEHVDRLLRTIERLAVPSTSPFSREQRDVPPEVARELEVATAEVRRVMLQALDALGIGVSNAPVSARQAIDAYLLFADTALEELTPAELRGYGAVDEQAAAELASHVRVLHELLREARAAVRRATSDSSDRSR